MISPEREFAPVKAALRDRALEVCQMLLPAGFKTGPQYRCGGLDGEPGESMAVYLPEGSWEDFATGDKGDLIDLWAKRRGVDLPSARDQAAEWVGLTVNGRRHPLPELTIRSEQSNVMQFEPKQSGPPDRAPDKIWEYYQADGDLAFRAARWDLEGGKKFIVPQHIVNGRFINGLPDRFKGDAPEKMPLLYLGEAASARVVVLVEGEKACDAVRDAGYAATTNQGGASNLEKQDWSVLNGATVVLWQDNDKAGDVWAEKLKVIIPATTEGVKLLSVTVPHNFEAKWDAADVPADVVRELVDKALRNRKPLKPGNLWARQSFDIGDLKAEPLPPEKWLIDGVLPSGFMSMWAADGGLGKSMLALDLAVKVAMPSSDIRGERFLGARILNPGRSFVLSCEDDINHMRRRLRNIYGDRVEDWLAGNVRLASMQDIIAHSPSTTTAFVERNPMTGRYETTQTFRDFRDYLLNMDKLELIVIDPLYSVAPGLLTEPGAMSVLTGELAALAAQTEAALLLVHHLTKIPANNPMKSRDDLRQLVSGSAQVVNAMRMVDVLAVSKTMQLPGEKVIEFVPVKCNLKHRQERRYLIRQENGLLSDETAQVKHDADSHQLRMRATLVHGIKKCAENGDPIAAYKRAERGAYKRQKDLGIRPALTMAEMEAVMDEAFAEGEIVRVPGSKNTRWLDIPGGAIHTIGNFDG